MEEIITYILIALLVLFVVFLTPARKSKISSPRFFERLYKEVGEVIDIGNNLSLRIDHGSGDRFRYVFIEVVLCDVVVEKYECGYFWKTEDNYIKFQAPWRKQIENELKNYYLKEKMMEEEVI